MKSEAQYQVSQITISPAKGFTVAETKQDYNVDRPSNFTNTFMGNDDVAEYLGGYNYAVIINKLLMLTENPRITGYQVDGKKWIRIGLFAGEEEITWAAMLKCLSPATIKKHLTQLQADGLIEFKQFKGKGRSLYYWLNTQALELLSEPVERVVKLRTTNAANSTFTQAKYTSDLTNREIKSDLTNREITYNESLNQVSRVVESSLTSRVTSKSPKNTENNQESHTACDFFSPLATVMANALKLDLSIKKNLDCVNLTLDKLNALYQDDVTETNIIKVSGLVLAKWGASPARVFSQWSSLLAKPEPTEAELKAIELQAKAELVANRIKEICKLPCAMGWEHKSVKAKKQLLMELSANIATNSQESKLDSFTWWGGNEKPTIDQFNRAWVDHVTKGEKNASTKQIDAYAIPATGALARATVM